jgi:hypothetical protein
MWNGRLSVFFDLDYLIKQLLFCRQVTLFDICLSHPSPVCGIVTLQSQTSDKEQNVSEKDNPVRKDKEHASVHGTHPLWRDYSKRQDTPQAVGSTWLAMWNLEEACQTFISELRPHKIQQATHRTHHHRIFSSM